MTTSSITVALPGKSSSICRGKSYPSEPETGPIGHDQRDLVLVPKRRTLAGVAPAKSKTDQTDDMARSDFYLVERPDHKYGTAHIALRQIRRQGRIRQSLLP